MVKLSSVAEFLPKLECCQYGFSTPYLRPEASAPNSALAHPLSGKSPSQNGRKTSVDPLSSGIFYLLLRAGKC